MSEPPRQRVILLGASNIARSVRTAVDAARAAHEGPIDILAALGHGRSLGMTSSVLGRYLPGILQCGLWRDWAELPAASTTALLTDIGNDLVYHVSAAQVAEWVEECLTRLAPHCDSLAMTELPMASVRDTSKARYLVFRALLFPRCRLDLETVLGRAEVLNEEIRRLAKKFSVRLIEPSREWYGLDPIHVRRKFVSQAWRDFLGPPVQTGEAAKASGAFLRRLYLHSLVPDARQIFWHKQHRAQPAGRLADGTTIALY